MSAAGRPALASRRWRTLPTPRSRRSKGSIRDGQHPLQKAWIDLQVPQCGYCQSGQIMQAAALLKDFPDPSDQDIDAVMTGNLCRCMTYVRIRNAIKQAGAELRKVATNG